MILVTNNQYQEISYNAHENAYVVAFEDALTLYAKAFLVFHEDVDREKLYKTLGSSQVHYGADFYAQTKGKIAARIAKSFALENVTTNPHDLVMEELDNAKGMKDDN